MSPTTLLVLVLALAFYNTGTIWAHEVDIFRSWRLVDRASFHRIQAVHQRERDRYPALDLQRVGAGT
jgi:hypothetical protein